MVKQQLWQGFSMTSAYRSWEEFRADKWYRRSVTQLWLRLSKTDRELYKQGVRWAIEDWRRRQETAGEQP